MDNTKKFTCLSLCSGYGGLELGLKRVVPSLRTVAYVEIEAFAVANLVKKMEQGLLDVAPVWTDIKTFNPNPFRHKIHIIAAGYPCQPFSFAGKRQGEKDPRHLWPIIAGIINKIKPAWCFLENVAGHLSKGFDQVYCDLKKMGYATEAGLFSAAEVGAPHLRKRLFVLAHYSDCRFQNGKSKQTGQSALELYAPKLAYPATQRIQGAESEGTTSTDRPIDESCYIQWPARPGQSQYRWEYPRTVGNSRSGGLLGQSRRGTGKKFTDRRNSRQTQSELGRAVNGTSCRVDRLRLLGNGVVPAQAEKALRCLYAKICNY